MKKIICALLSLLLLTVPALAINTLSDGDIAISAPSAVLMEKTSGEVIYEKNAHERMKEMVILYLLFRCRASGNQKTRLNF